MTIDGIAVHETITAERVMAAAEQDDDLGFCIACGCDAGGVEPDARKYKCEACGELAVYGAEDLVIQIA